MFDSFNSFVICQQSVSGFIYSTLLIYAEDHCETIYAFYHVNKLFSLGWVCHKY